MGVDDGKEVRAMAMNKFGAPEKGKVICGNDEVEKITEVKPEEEEKKQDTEKEKADAG